MAPFRASLPISIGLRAYRWNQAPLETELYSSLIPEVALVIVALREIIAKASQQVLKLRWPDGDVLVHGNVDASTNKEIKGIIAGGLAGDQTARSRAGRVEISVEIAVSAAEQRLGKWFEMRKAEFYDRTNVVGEQIALGRYGTRTIAVRGRDSKVVGIAAIALKLTLDSDQLGEVICN